MNPIQKINQIGAPVKDMKRAIAFYQSLHLPLLFFNRHDGFLRL